MVAERSFPLKRAVFIDGRNFKYASYDALHLKVDFEKFLKVLSEDRYLLRAYYYSGYWTEESIRAFMRLKKFEKRDSNEDFVVDEETQKEYEDYMEKRRKDLDFLRFLNRSGYNVIKKPVKVYKDYLTGELLVKADLDIEIVIDMLKLTPHIDEAVLVSGDGDFIPVIQEVQSRGVRVIVLTTLSKIAQANGYKASEELIDAADEFIELESLKSSISR